MISPEPRQVGQVALDDEEALLGADLAGAAAGRAGRGAAFGRASR